MKKCSVIGCENPNGALGFCQKHYKRFKIYGDPIFPKKKKQTDCTVTGCKRPFKGHGYCAFHLIRLKYKIPFDWVRPNLDKKRYKQIMIPGHYLADKLGRVYLHRLVLFNLIGNIKIPCFWCGITLEWKNNNYKKIFVDHLDHNRHNNMVKNLVPSCNNCNAGRTSTNSHIRQSIYSKK